MATVGVIGSGRIGGAVAALAVGAGHHVVLSNRRGPEALADLVAELGPLARAATPAEAARAGDIVVVSIPIEAYGQVPAEPLRGKVVVDTLNYNPERQGRRLPEIEDGDTPAEVILASHLTGSYVVKAFSNIFFKHLTELARPAGASDRSALPLASDDPGAKAAVAAFIDSLGFDPYDAGPLAESRRFAPGTPATYAYMDPIARYDGPGRPANAADLAKLLAATP